MKLWTWFINIAPTSWINFIFLKTNCVHGLSLQLGCPIFLKLWCQIKQSGFYHIFLLTVSITADTSAYCKREHCFTIWFCHHPFSQSLRSFHFTKRLTQASFWQVLHNYRDVIMSAMSSEITGVSIVYSTVCASTDQRKHQSSLSLEFLRAIHRLPMDFPHIGPVTRKMFSFDDAIMTRTDTSVFVHSYIEISVR